MSILEDFRTWLWIMKNKYNPHMSEYFFNRVGSNLPEQTFIKQRTLSKLEQGHLKSGVLCRIMTL
jgi:hypothetical protein